MYKVQCLNYKEIDIDHCTWSLTIKQSVSTRRSRQEKIALKQFQWEMASTLLNNAVNEFSLCLCIYSIILLLLYFCLKYHRPIVASHKLLVIFGRRYFPMISVNYGKRLSKKLPVCIQMCIIQYLSYITNNDNFTFIRLFLGRGGKKVEERS